MNDLVACSYRVAWRLDSRFDYLRKPSPTSLLGTVAHGVVEDVGRGRCRVNDREEARARVESAWDQHVVAAEKRLRQAWHPRATPAAKDWPGYELTRARVIRRATRWLQDISDGVHASVRALSVERTMRDDGTGVFGTPDRVETSNGRAVVVDLKTGIRQSEPSEDQRRQLLLYAHLVACTTGVLPSFIAVEDASGRRWQERISQEVVSAVVDEATRLRSRFNLAIEQAELRLLATPSADVCRFCPYRPVCNEYWSAIDDDWRHASIRGTVIDVSERGDGRLTTLEVASPMEAAGDRWTITQLTDSDIASGSLLSVVDAERSGAPRHLRARWNTVVLDMRPE